MPATEWAIDEVVVSASPGETRIALMAGGRPVELIVDRGDGAPGDLVLGRVLSVNRALNAAFVDIGEPQPGFLASPGRLSEGDSVLVQLTATARRGKGAALTTGLSLTGRLLAYTPMRAGLNLSRRLDEAARGRLKAAVQPWLAAGEGVVLRTAAADASDDDLLAELEAMREAWLAIQAAAAKAVPPARLRAPPPLERVLDEHPAVRRVCVDEAAALAEARLLFPEAELQRVAFEASGAAEALDAALETRVELPGGGALLIEQTAALTVIDIDSGGAAPLEANLAAVPEIARQMRLRGLAGHILVDVIPLRDRRALGRVVEALRRAVAPDPTPTQVVGVTALGLVEMTRERRRPPLAEVMLAPAGPRRNADSLGLEGLRALLRAAADRPAASLALAVAPPVAAALRRRPQALAEAARRLGRPVTLREDRGVDMFDLVEDKR